MPLIALTFRATMTDASDGVGLAWARSCPHGFIVGPSGKPERETPSSNSCEEMALGISSKLNWFDVTDVSFVNDAWCDVAGCDQVA